MFGNGPNRRKNFRCPEKILGFDRNYILAYYSYKTVMIKDARVGCMNYMLKVAIAAYILLYQLIRNLGYLAFAQAENTVRISLQQPTRDISSGLTCNPKDFRCRDAFAGIGELPYCCAQNSSCTNDGARGCRCTFSELPNYNCTYMDGGTAIWTTDFTGLVVTYVHQFLEQRNEDCFVGRTDTATARCDRLWFQLDSEKYFVADIESFTLLVDHQVRLDWGRASAYDLELVGMTMSFWEMPGFLYVGSEKPEQRALCLRNSRALDAVLNGKPTNTAPCYIPPQRIKPGHSATGGDFFSVGTLLEAAGTSLDAINHYGAQRRQQGFVVLLDIDYSNTMLWKGRVDMHYVYKPVAVPGTRYKKKRIESSVSHPGRRMQFDMHGILFVVQASGELAAFSFFELLLQLTTSLALLAVSTFCVNILANYVLHLRMYYQEALYQETVDYEGIKFLDSRPEAEIDEQLRTRSIPRSGSKEQRVLRLLEDGFYADHWLALHEGATPGLDEALDAVKEDSEADASEGTTWKDLAKAFAIATGTASRSSRSSREDGVPLSERCVDGRPAQEVELSTAPTVARRSSQPAHRF